MDYIVIDEFHHSAAKTYRKIIECLNYKFMLGLTATPFRSDRKDIIQLCNNNIIVNYELRTAVESGILSPYHYYGCFDNVDYSDIDLKSGKYSVRDLERKLIIKERHEAIIAKWKEKAAGKPTLAFCCSHRHAERIVAEFESHGIPSAAYISTTCRDERKKLINRLENGELKILCTVDVLNEGADIRFVECLMFLRPTESKRIFIQQLGRGLRKHVGKSHCVVIDFIGNFRNAYKLVEYHGIRPDDHEKRQNIPRTIRDILDIPIGCKVEFEDKVIDIFSSELLDPRFATRHNISRILLYQYQRLRKNIGREPTKREVDRFLILGASFYKQVFGGWGNFLEIVRSTENT